MLFIIVAIATLLLQGLIYQVSSLPGFFRSAPAQVPTTLTKEFVGRHCFLRNTVSANPYYKLYESYIDEIPISVIIMKAEDPVLWDLAVARETRGFYVVITGKMQLSTEYYTCKNV